MINQGQIQLGHIQQYVCVPVFVVDVPGLTLKLSNNGNQPFDNINYIVHGKTDNN